MKRERPKITHGKTTKFKMGCGTLYITVNADDVGICEVFVYLGGLGGCPSQSEATTRLASLALRSGVSVEEVVGQLKLIRCLSTERAKRLEGGEEIDVLSCADAIGRALEEFRGGDETESFNHSPLWNPWVSWV